MLGFRSIVSYKSAKTETFFLILQTLKSKYFPNIDRENFEELFSESEEARALSYDLLRRIVLGMAAYFVAQVIMAFILLNEKGCF